MIFYHLLNLFVVTQTDFTKKNKYAFQELYTDASLEIWAIEKLCNVLKQVFLKTENYMNSVFYTFTVSKRVGMERCYCIGVAGPIRITRSNEW